MNILKNIVSVLLSAVWSRGVIAIGRLGVNNNDLFFAVWSVGSSDGIGGSRCRCEPAGFGDRDTSALGCDKQSQGHR